MYSLQGYFEEASGREYVWDMGERLFCYTRAEGDSSLNYFA